MNKVFNDFEIIEDYQPKKGKFSVYFIETHLKKHDKEIKISFDKDNQFFEGLEKIYQEEITNNNNNFLINVYKFYFIPTSINKAKIKYSTINTIEIKIILGQKKNKYESKNIINIEIDNFLGQIKFNKFVWCLKNYEPPEQTSLSHLEIMNLFNKGLIKENRNKSEDIYTQFIKYGINLIRNCNYNFQLFLMLYTISFQNENKLLAEELLNLFNIKKISQNDNLKILEYIEELDIIFDKQSNFLNQIKNLHSENFENYLIKFYTIHIYYLNEIKQKEKLSKVLNDLINNNIFDKLILPKLYLSDFYFYYKTLVISDEVKNMLLNNLINISKNFNDINNSFSLISDFFSMKFDVILLSVNNNYDKISLICKNENQSLNLNNYFNHNNEEKDKLLNIKEYLNFILDKKKETLFEAINIDINSYIYYITNDYSLDFLTFLELKLLESVISVKNIEDALLFSSNIKYKNFAPLLEIIIKYSEMFIKICQKSQKVIYIQKYIEQKNEDNLLNIQNLISNIIEIEKKESYQFIKFTANIWAPYLKFASFEGMKIIRKTLWICKEIDNAIDEEEIHLSTSIHNLGLELIRKGELKGENLLQFLGEDEVFYTNKKIKDLEFENTKTNKRIDNLNSQIENVQNQIKDLKREINSLSNSNNNLEKRVNKLESKVSELKYKISSMINNL